MLIIGLTGGIGSGKSVASDKFASLGITVVDADVASRTVVEPGMPALKEIESHFGPEIIAGDGQLDRTKLREIIASDAEERKWLESVLHPKIGEQITYSIQVETDSTNVVVFPEGQTFAPMEMVESLLADTTRLEKRFRLLKEYRLTQFDSGSYTIPQQRVMINDRVILTDSMRVEVADVAVE